MNRGAGSKRLSMACSGAFLLAGTLTFSILGAETLTYREMEGEAVTIHVLRFQAQGDGFRVELSSSRNEAVVRQNDWNEMTVTVLGNRYISRLNGVAMIDFTDPRADFLDGAIALQLHSGGEGHMLFKDIWIRDLTRR